MNTRTLIATYRDYTAARQAARELENSGVPAEAIDVHSKQKSIGAGSADFQNEENHAGFTKWWKGLFESKHEEERRGYKGALAGGIAILRATVSNDMVNPAVDVLNRYGAADIQRSEADPAVRTGVRVYSHADEPVEKAGHVKRGASGRGTAACGK